MSANNKVREGTIAEDIVVTKYKNAGEISNRILKLIIASAIPGKSVLELCIYGDELMIEETNKVYKKEKNLKKGIAVPTCISVNNCIFHFSPTRNDPDVELKDGDVVKINLGAHIDGFIASVAHTILIQSEPHAKVTGRKADTILAAYWASQAAIRLLIPGCYNSDITKAVQVVANNYQCKPVEGLFSHQLRQFEIDGLSTIIQNPTEAQRREHENYIFQTYEVWAIDVIVSSGEGIARKKGTRTSLFKKTDNNYQLKLKTSRAFLSEVKNKYGNFGFNIRNFEEEAKARMGISECIAHNVIRPCEVLYVKTNDIVARFKFTVLIMPNGINLVTGLPFDLSNFQSEYTVIDDKLRNLILAPIPSKASKSKAKKKGNVEEGATKV